MPDSAPASSQALPLPADVGVLAQRAAETHLAACEVAQFELEECGSADPADWPESPASAPFCGCQTCMVREVLHAAWPVFEEHSKQTP